MKVKLEMKLVGTDGNAFALMGKFSHEARRAGWTTEEIGEVLRESKSGDYDHLLRTLAEWTSD